MGFAQEGRRLESTLPATDHHDSFSAKAGQVPLLRGVRSQLPGDARKLRWSHSKRSDPSSDDDAPASYNFPIRQYHAEARCALFDFDNLSLLQVGNGTRLKPSIVSDLAGSDNWDASQGDRKHMPSGILRSQNDMVSPKTRTFTPHAFKCAAADNP